MIFGLKSVIDMSVYYLLYITAALALLFWVIRFLLYKSQPLPVHLYNKGLQAENDGKFYEATAIYENALQELKKFRFHKMLKKALVEKIKLLKQINKHGIDQKFVRSNNSWLEV